MAKKENGEEGSGSVTKMDMVRDAISSLGADAKPLAIQVHIKNKYTVEIPTTVISSYKNNINKSAGGKPDEAKAARQAIAKAVASVSDRAVVVNGSAEDVLAGLTTMKGLISKFGISNVRKMVDFLDK